MLHQKAWAGHVGCRAEPLRRGTVWLFVCLLAILALPPVTAAHADAPHLIAFAARVAGDAHRTRVIIDFDKKPDASVRYVASPARILVDLPSTAFAFADGDLNPRGLFSHIRYGAMGPGRSRIVLTSDSPVRVDLNEVVKSPSGTGFRLVLDVTTTTPEEFAKIIKAQRWSPETAADTSPDQSVSVAPVPARGPFTVVVDPGHGGIDSGAVGVDGTLEKNVTLAFGKALAAKLEERGIRVFLTRGDDTFLSLGDRVAFGRAHGASLFISIHANSISQDSIRGATVYTLSDKASDHLAQVIAERENESDEVAGISFKGEPKGVADILVDLTRRETQVFSIGLADKIVSAFDGNVLLINNPHRYAGFRVLMAADVPSVLVELGYLSNTADEKLLNDPDWQAKVASLLVQSIVNYRSTILASGN